MFTAWMQGRPDDDPGRYAAASPITYAQEVRAPLLVIHGTDDIRCPPGQMRRYLARMAELGKSVDEERFAAGYIGGLANPSLLLEHTRRMLAFARHVTG